MTPLSWVLFVGCLVVSWAAGWITKGYFVERDQFAREEAAEIDYDDPEVQRQLDGFHADNVAFAPTKKDFDA